MKFENQLTSKFRPIITSMSTFALKEPFLSHLPKFSNSYNDAFLHSEDDKVFKAHKLILAIHSPYLHRLFQLKKGNNDAEILVLNTPSDVLGNVLDLIYGQDVCVKSEDVTRFEDLLQKWKVDYRHINMEMRDLMSKNKCVDEKQNTTSLEDIDCEDGITTDNLKSPENSGVLFEKTADIPYQDSLDSKKEEGSINVNIGDMEMTNTDPTEINNLMGYINHEMINKSSKNHTYMCLGCKTVSLYFQQAQSHFALFHQDNKNEIETLKEAESLRSVASRYFSALSIELEQGDIINSVGRLMDSTRKLRRVKETLDMVKTIQKPVFPPTLKRKKDALERDLGKFLRLGEECIDKLENMTT